MSVQTCLPGLDEQPDLQRAAGMVARRELRAPTRFMVGMCGVLSLRAFTPHVPSGVGV